MKVNIKKLVENAVIPTYAKPGDAGMDLYSTSIEVSEDGVVTYGTGLSMEIPEGYVGLLFPRSSNYKQDLVLCNSVGVIDSGYRGEIMFKYFQIGENMYKVGDRVGQIIILPYPQIEFAEVDDLSKTERGEGGFGHTGE
jgi:dUTP pyrophosphatase